jgi:hypothetical protein
LWPALGHHALDESGEIISNVILSEQSGRPGADSSKCEVSIRVLERIVQSGLGAAPEALDKRRVNPCIGNVEKPLAVHRVNDVVPDMIRIEPGPGHEQMQGLEAYCPPF